MARPDLFFSVLKIVKYSHRHPANVALHCIGLPIYGAGLFWSISSFSDGIVQWAGLELVAAAIPMFLVGHAIERNLKSMTPILMARLLLRALVNARRDLV